MWAWRHEQDSSNVRHEKSLLCQTSNMLMVTIFSSFHAPVALNIPGLPVLGLRDLPDTVMLSMTLLNPRPWNPLFRAQMPVRARVGIVVLPVRVAMSLRLFMLLVSVASFWRGALTPKEKMATFQTIHYMLPATASVQVQAIPPQISPAEAALHLRLLATAMPSEISKRGFLVVLRMPLTTRHKIWNLFCHIIISITSPGQVLEGKLTFLRNTDLIRC